MTDRYGSLSDRDKAAVRLVGKFGQMTARQIGEVLFAEQTSRTPRDRCLKRLTDRGYLSRLELRVVGGTTGGSSQFVYQLGRAGWRFLNRQGRYWAHRSVNRHALELAEVYVVLTALERDGVVKVLQFDVEHEAWCEVAGVRLTPDAYLEVGYPGHARRSRYLVELDRATESVNRLREKCERYRAAYEAWDGPGFPWVLFVVPDEARGRCIVGVIAELPADVREAFDVCRPADLERHLCSLITVLPPSKDRS